MLVLLPPSEGKTEARRGAPLDLSRLTGASHLTEMRARVLEALIAASAGPDPHRDLGIPRTLGEQIARNLVLPTEPTAAAARVYTGVLYAALDHASLDPASRRRAARRLLVVSALFGALRMTDRIPAYRLSMGVDLPGVGPLARAWRAPLDSLIPALVGRGLLIDARSSSYLSAWTPTGDLAQRWVRITVPGASHLAKHTRGLVARHLCLTGEDPRTPQQVADLLAGTMRVHLHAPDRPGRGHTLDCGLSARDACNPATSRAPGMGITSG